MSPAALDDEAQETRYCVPISSLTHPVEVGQIGYGNPRLLSNQPKQESQAWVKFSSLMRQKSC
jgi:hypothetical protein